jgi:hypothetical protein
MANEWFCKLAGTEIGPLSPQQLKAMAVKGRLTPDDEVRRGTNGKWSPASAVTGLFPKADSSAAWADTTEIPIEAAKTAPAVNPAAKSKPAAARAVKPVNLPVAKAVPQPPPVGAAAALPVAAPIAMPVSAVGRPKAAGASASNSMPVAAGTGRVGARAGKHANADAVDFKQRKKERQKKLVFGLAGLIGLLAIAGIVVAIVRSNSSGTPAASADDAKTVAKKTSAVPVDLEADIGTRPAERTATTGTTKTAAEAPKTDAAKPAPAETPAKAADDGWHTAGGEAVACGDASVKIPSVMLKTVSATRMRGKEVLGQVVREQLLITVELTNKHSTRRLEFASWSFPKPGNVPTLADSMGKRYDLRPPRAPTPGESVDPGKAVEDVLTFQRPAESAKPESLQLRLPAAAFGGQGTLNFEIPAAMIEPEPEKGKPGTRPKNKDDVLGLGDDTPEQPKTPEKEPPPEAKQPPAKKDKPEGTIPRIEDDIDALGGGDKSRT